MKNFYVYVFLDPRKPGNYCYGDLSFICEPFYIGKGMLNRINISKYDKSNKFKVNKIKKIESCGLKIISYKVFDNLTEEESFTIEKDLINKIGKLINESGPLVNFSDGGNGGDNITNHPNKDKIIEKMRISHLGDKNKFYGKNHSDATKKRLSEIMSEIMLGEKNPFYGKKHTETTKKLQSDIKKNKYDGEKNPFYGKKHSDETKNIMKKKSTGKKHNELTKLKISESSKGKRTGINNPSATKYIIESPQGEILEFIGIKNLDLSLKGINPRRILKQKEHKGYKLLEIIKLNQKVLEVVE